MLNTTLLDEFAARIGEAVRASPAADFEKNLKAVLTSGLARLDVVPRAEYDLAVELLRSTRAKLDALAGRVDALERARGG